MDAYRSPTGEMAPDFCGSDKEPARSAILQYYDLDSLYDDPELNAIRGFAAKLCDAPMAIISLVETDRQRFLSRQGVDATETPRNVSFCQHAMFEPGIMEISDATQDVRFAKSPLVTAGLNIRFYAGAPLISEEGAPLGTVCVMDSKPREGLTSLQRDGLLMLASATMRRLAARRREIESTAGRKEADRLLDESQRQFDNLADALPQMAWSTDAEGKADYFNKRWQEFTGASDTEHHGDHWMDAVHPDDRERAAKVWQEAVDKGETYEVEYRVRTAAGDYRWTLARGLPVRSRDGEVVRWFGTNTDIHETRLLVESQRLLSQELSHRIKNIFSVVSGLVSFASRGNPEIQGLAAEISDRIAALGRAHNYVRPIADEPAAKVTLKAMLDDLFAPYAEGGAPRVHVEGAGLNIRESAVTPLALAFHELATNAVKYGALSVPSGNVEVQIARDGDNLVMRWQEHGGPTLDGAPDHGGFGTDLMALSIERQLGGTVKRDWSGDGLCAALTVEAAKIVDDA